MTSGSWCILRVPPLYQQLAQLATGADPIVAIDAEDVALAAATILCHPQPHRGREYHLRGHPISSEYLAAIQSSLPRSLSSESVPYW